QGGVCLYGGSGAGGGLARAAGEGAGEGGGVRRFLHQTRCTPYGSKATSALMIGTPSVSAWAMMRRSKGSLWWYGRLTCRSPYSTVRGKMESGRSATACVIH